MRVTQVKYGMRREIRKGAIDSVEVTIDVEPGDSPQEAIQGARAKCDEAISTARDSDIRDRLRVKMSTEQGRQELARFLSEIRP